MLLAATRSPMSIVVVKKPPAGSHCVVTVPRSVPERPSAKNSMLLPAAAVEL